MEQSTNNIHPNLGRIFVAGLSYENITKGIEKMLENIKRRKDIYRPVKQRKKKKLSMNPGNVANVRNLKATLILLNM